MSTQEIKLLTGDDHLASHGHLHRPQWEASNRFSLLSNLDREGDPWSKEEVEDVFMETHPEVNYGSASQTGMMFSGVELVNGLQNGGRSFYFFHGNKVELTLVFLVVGGKRVVHWNVYRCLGGILRQLRIRC